MVRRRATTGRNTYGNVSRVSTLKAPQNPLTCGSGSELPKRLSSRPPGLNAAIRATAPTNEGITSGRQSTSAHHRRPRRSVRATIHAAPVPMRPAAAATDVPSSRLRNAGAMVSLLLIAAHRPPRSPALRTIR